MSQASPNAARQVILLDSYESLILTSALLRGSIIASYQGSIPRAPKKFSLLFFDGAGIY